MSTGFDIIVEPGESAAADPLTFYGHLLECALDSVEINKTGIRLEIFRDQRPSNYGVGTADPNVVMDEKLEESSFAQLFGMIKAAAPPKVFVGVSSSYERFSWSNEICDVVPSKGWVAIEYESKDFALGHGARLHGSHRIHFDERNVFTNRVVDLSRCPASSPAALAKIVQYGSNFRFLENLFKKLADKLRPLGMTLVTEGAARRPFDFHMVYRDRLAGYLVDAKQMLQQHQINPDQSFYETDIRSVVDAEGLAERLDLFLELLSGRSIEELNLSDDEILECVTANNLGETEVIHEGLFVESGGGLFGYLDSVYLGLLDKAISNGSNVS